MELTRKMIDYLRSGPLYHRPVCPVNEKPSGAAEAMQGEGQFPRSYACTCGAQELREMVGKS